MILFDPMGLKSIYLVYTVVCVTKFDGIAVVYS